MSKCFKKLLAVVLAAIICLNISSVFACAIENNMTLTVATVSAKAGKSVDVKIDLSNNDGIASLKFDVRYDSMLTLENVVLCNDFAYATTPTPYKNPQTISMMSPLSEVTANGTVATLTFKVSDKAPANYKADITLTYDPEDIFDIDMDNVTCDIVDGAVSIIGEAPTYTSHIISVTNGVAYVGSSAKITVVTDLSVTKLQFVTAYGSTITISKRVVSGNQKIWTLEKEYSKGVYNYSIKEKVNDKWFEGGQKASLTFNAKTLKIGMVTAARFDEASGFYKIAINGSALKVQFITPEGLTRTYSKTNSDVKSVVVNGDGTEIWFVSPKLRSGVNYIVAAKFSAGWNYTDTVSVIAK